MRRWAVVLLALVLASVAHAGVVRVGNSFADTRVTVTADTADRIDLTILPGAVRLGDAKRDGRYFTAVELAGEARTSRPGFPALPAVRRLVQVPVNAIASIEVRRIDQTRVDLAAFGLAREVLPAQDPVEKRPGAYDEAIFRFDARAYARAGFFYAGARAAIEGPAALRGTRVLTVEARPVDYDPARGVLSVATRIDLRVHLRRPASGPAVYLRDAALYNARFDALVARAVVNPHRSAKAFVPDAPATYLVIAGTQWVDNPDLADLVGWKTRKGYDAVLVSTDETGLSTQGIKDYIQEAYDNWPHPPAFVLLVGDTNQVPYFVGTQSDNPATDLYYTTLEGDDFLPDVYLGRLSPSSSSDLSHIVGKILQFEQAAWSEDDDWIRRATFLASTDNYDISEGTHNYCIDAYLDPLGYTSYKRYSYTYDATAAQVSGDIDAGLSQVTYSGHGSDTYWADGPAYYPEDVAALTNDVFPFVQSYACLTGKYEDSECFGETWVRSATGAVAFFGSSVTSYWDEDDILQRVLYDGIYANPGVGEPDLTWLGGMTQYGKLGVYNAYSGGESTQRYYEMYNILGDAETDLWTGPPAEPGVFHPAVIYFGSTTLTVTVAGTPRALVGFSKDGGFVASAHTDDAGVAVLDFPPITEGGEYDVTVTGHDLRPYEGTVLATAASSDGIVMMDRERYSGADVIHLLVSDADLIDDGEVEVRVTSDAMPGGVAVTLGEYKSGTGAFGGSVETTTTPAAGKLTVANENTIVATYRDAWTGFQPNVDKTDEATADTAGPTFTGLGEVVPGDMVNHLSWDAASDPAGVRHYRVYRALTPGGEDFGAPLVTTTATALDDAGLINGTPYYYVVRAVDALGNAETNAVEKSGTPVGPVLIWSEDWDEKAIDDWTIVDGDSDGWTWTLDNPCYRDNSSVWTGNFLLADSDCAGSSVWLDEEAISPAIDATGYFDLVLKVKQQFYAFAYGGGNDTGDIEYRVGGGDWTVVAHYTSDQEGQTAIPLAGLVSPADLEIRFHYYDANYDWYWGIDDIELWGMWDGAGDDDTADDDTTDDDTSDDDTTDDDTTDDDTTDDDTTDDDTTDDDTVDDDTTVDDDAGDDDGGDDDDDNDDGCGC
jgi:hypothetical protein